MQFSILMKNEGNGYLAVRQPRKMPGDYLLKVILITNQNFQLALINTNIFR
jgi:hypothetical protein